MLANLAWAGPTAVITLGDALVPARQPVAAATRPSIPGGWVAVLADCLQEHAPGRFTVVDRTVVGESVTAARARAGDLREGAPALVVVALGAAELGEGWQPAAARKSFDALIAALGAREERPPRVLLVSPALPPAAGAEPKVARLVEQARGLNQVLAELARQEPAVAHVDLLAGWPRDEEGRAALVAGNTLSDQGHARVGASVCDAIVALD